eukprot:TRINITY_DN6348_c0_g1_i12.p2 TRINITY_DN6348_c0_g1~~TRINITY_DN6348_c0_g1_i12.p2  ORF type:complete len:223 (+),score=-18.27 TRINITY_DN6348_c0_g1_i12:2095-2763(+)
MCLIQHVFFMTFDKYQLQYLQKKQKNQIVIIIIEHFDTHNLFFIKQVRQYQLQKSVVFFNSFLQLIIIQCMLFLIYSLIKFNFLKEQYVLQNYFVQKIRLFSVSYNKIFFKYFYCNFLQFKILSLVNIINLILLIKLNQRCTQQNYISQLPTQKLNQRQNQIKFKLKILFTKLFFSFTNIKIKQNKVKFNCKLLNQIKDIIYQIIFLNYQNKKKQIKFNDKL